MGVHESLKFVTLFELFGSWQALLLLLLIEHHLFDYAASLAVQVGQLGVLRLDLLRVNLSVAFKYAVPPVLALFLRQHQLQHPLTIRIALQCPQRVV